MLVIETRATQLSSLYPLVRYLCSASCFHHLKLHQNMDDKLLL